MAALIIPDEEECYLLAILDGPDGVDLSEFCWYDPESEDGCYRLRDYQWRWLTCDDTYQADQGGRALGKTYGITMRAFAFPFCYPGQKMLLTAPELNHLRPLTDAIEARLDTTRLIREIRPKGKGGGITKVPHWLAKFTNGAVIISRLPNKDGKGVKSMHVLQIEMDESQNYPLAGWVELFPCLNRGEPGAAFRVHGVPKGARDRFWDITEGQTTAEDKQWTVHRPMAQMRPTWGPEERAENITTYGGSRQNIDYKRNIYGEHGDKTQAVFVLARLMDCCDKDEGSTYNTDVYTCIRLEYERLPSTDGLDLEQANQLRRASITSFLDVPGTHFSGYSQRVTIDRRTVEVGSPKGYSAYWGGADIGVTNHPSEFLIFGQRRETDVLELLLRVHMQRIPAQDQIYVVEWLFEKYPGLKAFGVDKTGVGQPIWDTAHRQPAYGDRVFGYGFSEKVPTAFEDRPLVDKETMEDIAIMRNVVEASTDWLRNDYVDQKKIRLPYDREILLEFQGQTYVVQTAVGNPYGTNRIYGGGSFHALDAAKMMVAAKHLPPVQAIIDAKPTAQRPVLDQFLGDE